MSTTTKIRRSNSATIGNAGHFLLHIVEALFLIYSAYHGIHATTTYRAAAGLGNLAGILGIVAIEVTMLAIYLAWVNHKLSGSKQQIAAFATYAVGFIFACLGIIGDSQLQAGIPVSSWISIYLTTILPAAPAIMAVGGFLIVMTGPEATRRRSEAEDEQDILEDEHNLRMDLRRAEAQAAAQLKAIELDTKLALASQMKQYVSSPAAQSAIIATAERDAPALLRAIGIYITDEPPAPRRQDPHYGTVTIPELRELIDLGHIPAPVSRPAAPETHPNGRAGASENGHH
jgi:hypothetical protein